MKIILGWILLVSGAGAGVWFLGLTVVYFWKYVVCEGLSCGELLMGPAVGSLFAAPSWLVASLGVFVLSEKIYKYIQYLVYFLAATMSSTLSYFLVFG